VRFLPTRFTPASSTHVGKECGGAQIYLDDWRRFEPLPVGLALARSLKSLYPKEWNSRRYQVLLGHPPTFAALERGASVAEMVGLWRADLARFRAVRRRHLLY
jgi:uncharacterized protein YbbC (DUF1343 family)